MGGIWSHERKSIDVEEKELLRKFERFSQGSRGVEVQKEAHGLHIKMWLFCFKNCSWNNLWILYYDFWASITAYTFNFENLKHKNMNSRMWRQMKIRNRNNVLIKSTITKT